MNIPEEEENEIILPWDSISDTFKYHKTKKLDSAKLTTNDLTSLIESMKSTKYFSADPFSLKRIVLCLLLTVFISLTGGIIFILYLAQGTENGISIFTLIFLFICLFFVVCCIIFGFGGYYKRVEKDFYSRRELKFRRIAMRVQESKFVNKGACIRIGKYGTYIKVVLKSEKEARNDILMVKKYSNLLEQKL